MDRKLPPLMLLGAGVMQVPVIREARRMGGRILAVDGSPEAPGSSLADWFLPVDLRDQEGLIQAARQGRKDFGLAGILTVGTDFSAPAAAVAEAMGWPGIPHAAARNASEKDRMRRCFDQAGVASPGYTAFSPGEIPSIPFGFPRVVKPVDNMGARGIRKVLAEEEMAGAVEEARRYAREGRVIVEEYIDGPEYSLDAAVWEDQLIPFGLADRHIRFEPYFIEMGHTLPADLPPEDARRLEELLLQGARALGIDRGMVKGDLKMSPRGPVICEMAARLSGGYMSGWTYPGASGRSSIRAALRLAAGLSPLEGNEPTDRGWTAAERAYISLPGRIAEVLDWGNPRDYHFGRLTPGDHAVFPRNNVEKGGNVVVLDSRRDRAVQRAQAAAAGFLLRLEPGNPDTAEFLLDSRMPGSLQTPRPTWPPWCFPITAAEEAEMEKAPWFTSPEIGLGWTLSREAAFDEIRYSPGFVTAEREKEPRRGWHGETFGEVLDRLRALTGIQPQLENRNSGGSPRLEITLHRLLWQSLLRGGLQGGVWIIDTLRAGRWKALTPYFSPRRRQASGDNIETGLEEQSWES